MDEKIVSVRYGSQGLIIGEAKIKRTFTGVSIEMNLTGMITENLLGDSTDEIAVWVSDYEIPKED